MPRPSPYRDSAADKLEQYARRIELDVQAGRAIESVLAELLAECGRGPAEPSCEGRLVDAPLTFAEADVECVTGDEVGTFVKTVNALDELHGVRTIGDLLRRPLRDLIGQRQQRALGPTSLGIVLRANLVLAVRCHAQAEADLGLNPRSRPR